MIIDDILQLNLNLTNFFFYSLMCLSSMSLVYLTLILSRFYRLTTEWDNFICVNELLCPNLDELESVLSHIEQ